MDNPPSVWLKTDSELELSPKTYQAARLEALGFKGVEICEKLGVSASWLSITRKSPLFKQTVAELEKQINEGAIRARKMVMDAAPRAAEILIEKMEDSEHPRIQKEICVDILKGVSTLQPEDTRPRVQINISDSRLELIAQTLKEL